MKFDAETQVNFSLFCGLHLLRIPSRYDCTTATKVAKKTHFREISGNKRNKNQSGSFWFHPALFFFFENMNHDYTLQHFLV
jgi:hypothetical protein